MHIFFFTNITMSGEGTSQSNLYESDENSYSTPESEDEVDHDPIAAIESDRELESSNDTTSDVDDSESDDNTPGNIPLFDWIEGNTTLPIFQFDSTSSGVKFQADRNSEEIFFFKKFLSQDIIELIVEETNKQYRFVKNKLPPGSKSTRMDSWVDTDVDEIYTFLAVSFPMCRMCDVQKFKKSARGTLVHGYFTIFTDFLKYDAAK